MVVKSGASNASEAAILDDPTVGLGSSGSPRSGMHIHLFYTDNFAGDPTMQDDGTLNTDLHALTASGGGPQAVSSSNFAAASAGNPTTKALTGTGFTWTAGASFGNLCWWAITKGSHGTQATSDTDWNNNFKTDMIFHGPITDDAGDPTYITVGNGESFTFDVDNPIVVQLGDTTDSFG